MPKQIYFHGPIHTAVVQWMKANNIDPNLVRSYKVSREGAGEMWIEVSMFCNDRKEVE